MTIRNRFLALIVAVTAIVSCDGIGKTYFSELDFRRDHGNEYAYKKDGNVFSGTAWSSDGKTIKIDVNNGVITNVTMYHSNGNVAGTARPGASNSETYFDINGKTITRQQFKQQYPDVMIQVGAFEHEVQYLQK